MIGSHRANEFVNIPLHVLTGKPEMSSVITNEIKYNPVPHLWVPLLLRKGEKLSLYNHVLVKCHDIYCDDCRLFSKGQECYGQSFLTRQVCLFFLW